MAGPFVTDGSLKYFRFCKLLRKSDIAVLKAFFMNLCLCQVFEFTQPHASSYNHVQVHTTSCKFTQPCAPWLRGCQKARFLKQCLKWQHKCHMLVTKTQFTFKDSAASNIWARMLFHTTTWWFITSMMILHFVIWDSAPCNFADTDTVRAQSRSELSAALEG